MDSEGVNLQQHFGLVCDVLHMNGKLGGMRRGEREVLWVALREELQEGKEEGMEVNQNTPL